MTEYAPRQLSGAGTLAGDPRWVRPSATRRRRRANTVRAFSRTFTTLTFALILSGLAYPLPVAGSLQWSQVVLALVVLVWFVASVAIPRGSLTPFQRSLLTMGLVLTACASAAILTFGPGERLLSEAPKVLLLFLGALAISAIGRERLFAVLPWAAMVSAGAICASWVITTSRYEYGGRLQLPEFGSPNTLGFMIAVIVIVLIHSSYPQGSYRLVRLVRWPVIGVLLWFLLETTSRGGIFALLAGLIMGLLFGRLGGVNGRGGRWLTTVVVLGGGLALAYVLSADGLAAQVLNRLDLGAKNASSGRTTIWLELLGRQFDSPQAMIFGFGPGSIDLSIMNKTVNSAHSTFVTMFSYFGAVGLLAFAALIIRSWVRALRSPDENTPVRIALLAAVTLSFAVDSVALSTQGALLATVALAASGASGSSGASGQQRTEQARPASAGRASDSAPLAHSGRAVTRRRRSARVRPHTHTRTRLSGTTR